ncbi:nucleotide exchange factor GrpE [Millisia brevis]|uniref:nucleotide exchange factor GrpE n=1 Tax=Millisia brevis TaxID=264148 RepID=UPI000829E6EB|nr:nucleotide exchange factor GrpE [Millisia brevis]
MPSSPATEGRDRSDADRRPDSEADAGASASEAIAADTADAEVVALRDEVADLRDRLLRARADLENYRRRTAEEGDRRAEQAKRGQLREWLDAVDSVERALTIQPDDAGLKAVLEQMNNILSRNGIQRVAGKGSTFDPRVHEAIAAVPAPGAPDRSIIEVARSGFETAGGDVLREAQVVVAKNPNGST